MERSVYVLALLNFALIGALPRIFFRRGTFNARWWATALPLIFAALLMLAGAAGLLSPAFSLSPSLATMLGALAVLLCAASILLIDLTIATHRTPLSLWHQDEQRPVALVTTGPYAWVRHPFYAAFMLALVASFVALPHPLTFIAAVAGCTQLHRTARGEERRLLDCAGGDVYAAYMKKTGRFLPRRRKRPVATVTAATSGGYRGQEAKFEQ